VNAAEVLASREPALWADLRRDVAPAAREALFDLHLPFARKIARQQFHDRPGGDIEFGDLLQLACAGLLEAIDRFDPARGAMFQSFAERRISGAILNSISHFSEYREQKAFQRRIKRERMASLNAGRATGRAAKARSRSDLTELAIGLAIGFMLEGTGLYHDDTAPQPWNNPYDTVAWNQTVTRLANELALLGERERRILQHHYVEGLTFGMIAALIGLSKARVSQLHQAALATLRERLFPRQKFYLKI